MRERPKQGEQAAAVLMSALTPTLHLRPLSLYQVHTQVLNNNNKTSQARPAMRPPPAAFGFQRGKSQPPLPPSLPSSLPPSPAHTYIYTHAGGGALALILCVLHRRGGILSFVQVRFGCAEKEKGGREGGRARGWREG